MAAAPEVRESLLTEEQLERLDAAHYLDVLEDMLAAMREDEVAVLSGVAWETRHLGDTTTGVTYFICTDGGLYFPVDDSATGRHRAVVVRREDAVDARASAPAEFLAADYHGEGGTHLGGITFHPMVLVDDHIPTRTQAQTVADALGVTWRDPDFDVIG